MSDSQIQELVYPKCIFVLLSGQILQKFAHFQVIDNLFDYLEIELGLRTHMIFDVLLLRFGFSQIFIVLGAVIADYHYGKYWSTLVFWTIQDLGMIILSVGATKIHGAVLELSWLGVLILSCGTGSAACIIPLGGDQFKMPQQKRHLVRYFSLFYWVSSVGQLIAILVPNATEYQCLGENSCFNITFGIAAVAMTTGLGILSCTKHMFTVKKHENLVPLILKIIVRALHNRMRRIRGDRRAHWLDYASDKYTNYQIKAVKAFLATLPLFFTFALNKSLLEQQINIWWIHVKHMRGEVGIKTLSVDSMKLISYIMLIVFIPLLEFIIYPLTNICNCLTTLLQKLGIATLLIILSNVITMSLSFMVKESADMTVHILWIIPPMFLVMLSKAILEVQGSCFAYIEAPYELKAVLMSLWWISYYVGTKIEWAISEERIFKMNLVLEGVLFTLLGFFNFALFLFFSIRYEHSNFSN